MKLYSFTGACALAPHIALEWAGADYELELIKRSATREPEFLKLNPVGKVPVLVLDDDTVLTEVNAILLWIAEQWPAADISYEDSETGRFEMRKWLSEFNGDIHPALTPYFLTFRFAESDDAQAQAKASAAQEVDFQLSIVERHMADRTWMLGDRRSVLDAYLMVFCNWARFMPKPLDQYPNLNAFAGRMAKDEGVQSAMKQQGLIK